MSTADDGRHRVALELADRIARSENPLKKDGSPAKNGREYWFTLYDQCRKIVSDFDLNEVLQELNKTQHPDNKNSR